jgi:small redox-active disulfide protein 2
MAAVKEIKVLGTGCPKCTALLEHTQAAVDELNIECAVEKVTDIDEIIGFGVIMTPALLIDGDVKALGKVPSVEEIKAFLR